MSAQRTISVALALVGASNELGCVYVPEDLTPRRTVLAAALLAAYP